MKKKRIITLALAAALILALSVAAYAVWSIHTERQQELKADLKIEENNVSSYMEYTAPDEQASGLVLLSSVNDGQEQHVYVNISPVTKKEAANSSRSYDQLALYSILADLLFNKLDKELAVAIVIKYGLDPAVSYDSNFTHKKVEKLSAEGVKKLKAIANKIAETEA